MRVRGVLLTLGVVFALGFTACSDGDDESETVEDEIRDAIEEGDLDEGDDDGATCEIVTQDDAEDLFGEPAVANDAGLVAPSCNWESADADEPGEVIHLLQASVGGRRQRARRSGRVLRHRSDRRPG
jgi:hypothetical protein